MENYYKNYVDRVIQLAETIVIKSSDAATLINRLVTENYGPDAVDTAVPASWKYYLNLGGDYHRSDRVMEVVSMDTLETVVFSKLTLREHPATRRAYAFGTRQYKTLVSQYPTQEMLILGILYPVDIAKAIAAEDGAILGYPADLVEINEYSLIPKLEQWVKDFKVRWYNPQFTVTDSLYAASCLGIMYLNLVPTILNFRLEACKTSEAHSFHVRQYLASHGGLDIYMDQMTLKQTLWLYRNIAYIERNAGKKENFEWLVEHIMTERSLPLAEFVMRHDLSKQPDELYPTLSFRRNPINLGYNLDSYNSLTLSEVLDKEDNFARSNKAVRGEEEINIKEAMESSLSNVVLTKLLESAAIDYSNNTPYTLEDILLNHWIWLASSGYYTAFVGVTNPRTGERIPLNVKEAYAFAWYAFCRSIGLIMDEIPKVSAKRVVLIPQPSVRDLMRVVDKKLVPEQIARDALAVMPRIVPMFSTESFYAKCRELYSAAQVQRRLISSQEHHRRRGMVHGMVSRIYSDNICEIAEPGERYSRWFADRNIAIDDFSSADFGVMYLEIVKEATGLDLINAKSLKDIQAAMIKIMTQLSSYSIQFASKINNSKLKVTDWTAVRLGDVTSKTTQSYEMPIGNIGLRARRMRGHTRIEFDVNDTILMGSRTKQTIAFKMELPRLVRPRHSLFDQRLVMKTANINSRLRPKSGSGVFGMDQYNALTEKEQQTRFHDVYNNDYFPYLPDDQTAPKDIPLSDIIKVTKMNGLNYSPRKFD